MKYILLLLLLIFISSCSKEETPSLETLKKDTGEEIENPGDTNLTPEEKFSALLMSDLPESSEDGDLADFVETEIFKTAQNYNGTAMVEVNPNAWLVSFEKEGTSKNYLLQKYIDNRTNEYYFSMKETGLTISDIVSGKTIKLSSGD